MTKAETLDIIVKRQLKTNVRCIVVGTEELINYKASLPFDLVQGEILTVQVNKRWRYRKLNNISGEIINRRIDVTALPIQPLKITYIGEWDPKDHYWGKRNEHLQEWAKPIYDFGKRQKFAMEEIIPGFDPTYLKPDPILEAIFLRNKGKIPQAIERFKDMLEEDFRCLQAYAHLGVIFFEIDANQSAKYYDIGMNIGLMSLKDDFNGLLPWVITKNRAFLRCLDGYGFCAWRNNHVDIALDTFKKQLWMNPSDDLSTRYLVDFITDGMKWEDYQKLKPSSK